MTCPPINKEERVAYAKGYHVTPSGDLISPKGRTLYPRMVSGGYLRFRHSKGAREIAVHRLHAYQLFGEALYADGIQVRHLDGNPQNNASANLALGTAQQNSMDKPAEVRMSAALKASKSIQKHDHAMILGPHISGLSYRQIMAQIGVRSAGTVSFIIRKSIESRRLLHGDFQRGTV